MYQFYSFGKKNEWVTNALKNVCIWLNQSQKSHPVLLIVFLSGIAGVGLTSESGLQAQNTLNTYKLEALNNHPTLLSKWNEVASSEFHARSIGIMDPTFLIGVFTTPIETALGAQTTRLSMNQSIPLS